MFRLGNDDRDFTLFGLGRDEWEFIDKRLAQQGRPPSGWRRSLSGTTATHEDFSWWETLASEYRSERI